MRSGFPIQTGIASLLVTMTVLVSPPAKSAEELVLAVQPILDEAQTRQAFQPLCDYLAEQSGRKCTLFTTGHFYPYWETIRHGQKFNLVLDAAHFTDYRVQKMGYQVLAKIPDTVSYTLVTRSADLVVEPNELIGKRVATLGIPSIGAARLNAMFPNPSRQPTAIEVPDAEHGIKLLLSGKVHAAILPTPIISQQMAAGAAISVVMTTDAIPHIALSAAPSLDSGTRELLRKALTNAHNTEAGRSMLKKIGFERFDPASASLYAGQGRMLKEYWGY